tara:strand:- start:1649 stop:1813 length:165 start_codon:yes stop_codon:yes gene_type:complete
MTEHEQDGRPWSRDSEPILLSFDDLDRFLDGLLKGERLESFDILGGGRPTQTSV